jgi:hypothetical protein
MLYLQIITELFRIIKYMSLVIAILNGNEIIIGADSLIWIKDESGKKQRGQYLNKVVKINQQLAVAITGATLDITLQIFKNYLTDLAHIIHFDTAFEILTQKINNPAFMVNHNEQYRVSVFGYNGKNPKIKSIALHAGYITDIDEAHTNLYFSGESKSVALAETLLAGSIIGSSADQISSVITAAITNCIMHYPDILSEPINIYVLNNHLYSTTP